MSPFAGIYNLIKSDNFDAYMAELGVNLVLRKLGSTAKPVTEIDEKDGNWRITTKTTFKTTEIRFRLGVPFEEETADGRKCQSVMTMQGDNTLYQKQLCSGKSHEIFRKFQGDEMLMTLMTGNVTAIRTYKKKTQ